MLRLLMVCIGLGMLNLLRGVMTTAELVLLRSAICPQRGLCGALNQH